MSIIAAYNFCNRDFDAFLTGAAAAGFSQVAVGFYPNYLDLPLEDLTQSQREDFQARLAAQGLGLVAVLASSNLMADDGVELLRRKLDGAASLGVGILDTGSARWPDGAPEAEREEVLGVWVPRMREAADHAASLGITIALETHGGQTGDTPACLQAMERIGHPAVRIAFDPANYRFYNGADPHERLDELVPFIAHTHYKDHRGAKGNADFPRIGMGEVGYETLVPRLVELGYAGPHTLERAPGDTLEEINASLAYAHDYLTRLLG